MHKVGISVEHFVRNVDEVEYRKEMIKSNVETKDKNTGRKKLYTYIFINKNKRRNAIKKESIHYHYYNKQRTSDIK